jgi:hypothetical protein
MDIRCHDRCGRSRWQAGACGGGVPWLTDAGTSIVLSAQPGADFHAETALEGVMQFFREDGLPPMLTFENDPRFVGKSLGRDFQIAPCAGCCSAWGSPQT